MSSGRGGRNVQAPAVTSQGTVAAVRVAAAVALLTAGGRDCGKFVLVRYSTTCGRASRRGKPFPAQMGLQ
jgi:hypothetical protein